MKTREAVIASITFAVAPINLFYSDYLWLNTPPMMFFSALAVYEFLSKKYGYAFICLAIATLFKQTALVLFPIFIIALLKETNRVGAIRNTALYGGVCFLGSLPYIVTIPADYLGSLGFSFFQVGSTASPFPYSISASTNLAWIFGDDAYYPAQPFLLGALLLSLAVLCLVVYETKAIGDKEFITYVLFALLLAHALFPRGIYKYYLAAVTPFGALLVENWETATLFLELNVLLLVIPRILTPWFVLAMLASLLISTRSRQRVSVRPPQTTNSDSPNQSKAPNS
jgi:predicted membrane-bound dolichyl-phosphate-mannose-protein mannosyltransferase